MGAVTAGPELEGPAVTPVTSSVPTAGGDQCPACGSPMLSDQRYCLTCGVRRGDPRLPFMDAVVFMDAMKQPQSAPAAAPSPQPDHRPWMSANASLVAGVATLVLAIGVGVLIGRSGDGSTNTAAAPQVIRVGGGEESATASTAKANEGATSTGGGKSKSASKKKAKEKTETGASGATKATEEAYKPAAGVKFAKPEQKLGGECDPSVAGCSKDGKFEGTFFE
jgi:hypothetical protein